MANLIFTLMALLIIVCLAMGCVIAVLLPVWLLLSAFDAPEPR